MNSNKVKIIILAAGRGKRMQSVLPKVLMPVKGKSMIQHLLESIAKSGVSENPCIVVGHGKEQVMSELGNKYEYVLQGEQLGTGHAVLSTRECSQHTDYIEVLSGDQPFTSPETIRNLMEKNESSKAKITFTTTELEDFEGWRKAFISFGRIIRKNGEVDSIKEYKDATEEEKNIKEVNAGSYVFESEWLWENLEKIKNNNSQKEYYLTDLVHIAKENNEKIETIKISPHEALGANNKEELSILEDVVI